MSGELRLTFTEIYEPRFYVKGLKEVREACGVTQKTLATYLMITPQYLCDIEKGRRPISDKQRKAIERKLLK